MRVFLTGATGLIGSAVLRRLVDSGHTVTALVRSPRQAAEIWDEAVTPVIGDLEQPQRFAAKIASSDGLIHAGSPGHYSHSIVDDAFISTVLMVLANTGKPFVTTSGLWVYGEGNDLREDDPFAPPPIVCWRPALTDRVRNAHGVRGIVIVPGLVHGQGRGMHTIIAGQRDDSGEPALMTIGTGRQHWPCVHVDDLADLYVRAVENAPAGSTFIGAAGDNPTVHEITLALSHKVGFEGRAVTETDQKAAIRLGQLGQALLLDQQASGQHARTMLGWNPKGPSLLEAIAAGTAAAPRPRYDSRVIRFPERARSVSRLRAVTATDRDSGWPRHSAAFVEAEIRREARLSAGWYPSAKAQ
jgi:nucleoside-diphosphate-sugar epimerase